MKSLSQKELSKITGGTVAAVAAIGGVLVGVFNAGYKFGADLANRGRR